MKKFGKKHFIIYGIITAVILALAALSFKFGNNPVSNAIGTVLSPIQKVCSSAYNGTKNFIGNIFSADDMAKENKKLKEKVLLLEAEVRMLDGYKTENEHLRGMIELKETRTDFNSIGANVIGKKTDEESSIITLDKGSKDGVKVNSVVFVPEGLVGVVFEVNTNFCKVRTIFDAESSVSAICLRSGDMGIAEPVEHKTTGGKCVLNYLDRSSKTVIGDIIETSGTGGIYPRGIKIGKVTEIKEDSRNLTLSATLETEIDVNRLDNVLIGIR
ncbi:MAG: rod shape-determining protein MreC [Ruminococcaceae bacterium]|nr:rod shape-determining protein MreC [Oscillospiraceae bacterium]